MNSSELHGLFRRDTGDTERPYLWDDAFVWQCMDDAYRMFARLTGGFADFTTPAVCEVAISAGDPLAALHPSILRTFSAHRLSDGGEIEIVNWTDVTPMTTTQGTVRILVIGMQRNVGRWINVPAVDDVAQLHVQRMPVDTITGHSQEFSDLGEEHHIHLLKWMKSLAYQKQDAETFDRKASEDNELRFRMYCEQVKAEKERYRHKTRTVAYGGV